MIGSLEGTVGARTADGCLLEVSGVGYRLLCSQTTVAALPAVGGRARLWTHLHVREDALTLYGFGAEMEQRMFEGLITVSGVGPKLALQICSALAPEALRRALVTDDVAALSAVPGVGKKTAQRIVLDLKEKMALPDLELVGERPSTLAEARSALENLGYSPGEVRAALGRVEVSPDDPIEQVVRSALRELG